MLSKVKYLVGATICAMVLTAAAPAEALLVLRLSDGNTTQTIADGSVLDITGPIPEGVVVFSGVIGDFNINVTSGISSLGPMVVPAGSAGLDLNSLDVYTNNPNINPSSQLTLELWDYGFPADPIGGSLKADWGGTITNGTVAGHAAKCAPITALQPPFPAITACNEIAAVDLGPFPGIAFVGSGNAPHGPVGPNYGLYIRNVMTFTASGQYSGNFQAINSPVPEPSSMMLFGTGLIGLARMIRRRTRKA